LVSYTRWGLGLLANQINRRTTEHKRKTAEDRNYYHVSQTWIPPVFRDRRWHTGGRFKEVMSPVGRRGNVAPPRRSTVRRFYTRASRRGTIKPCGCLCCLSRESRGSQEISCENVPTSLLDDRRFLMEVDSYSAGAARPSSGNESFRSPQTRFYA
jgi:hypothetical protein